jgi:hypothetical protein
VSLLGAAPSASLSPSLLSSAAFRPHFSMNCDARCDGTSKTAPKPSFVSVMRRASSTSSCDSLVFRKPKAWPGLSTAQEALHIATSRCKHHRGETRQQSRPGVVCCSAGWCRIRSASRPLLVHSIAHCLDRAWHAVSRQHSRVLPLPDCHKLAAQRLDQSVCTHLNCSVV